MQNSDSKEEITPKKSITLNKKRVKKIVFNQNKSQFALIWKNEKISKEIDQDQFVEIDKPQYGFTLYDS